MSTSPEQAGPPPRSEPPPMDEEERVFRASLGRTVDWYRVKQSRALWSAFAPAFVLLPLGSFLVALSLMPKLVPLRAQPLFTLLGLFVTALGPLWAMVLLLRSMRRDLYVAIRVDGLCIRLDPSEGERVFAWELIEDARYDEARRALSISLQGSEPVSIDATFSELELPELGRRIRDARRLAVWNRLEPRFQTADASE